MVIPKDRRLEHRLLFATAGIVIGAFAVIATRASDARHAFSTAFDGRRPPDSLLDARAAFDEEMKRTDQREEPGTIEVFCAEGCTSILDDRLNGADFGPNERVRWKAPPGQHVITVMSASGRKESAPVNVSSRGLGTLHF